MAPSQPDSLSFRSETGKFETSNDRVQGSALGPTTSGSHPTSDTNVVIRPSAEGSPASNPGAADLLQRMHAYRGHPVQRAEVRYGT